MKNLLKISLAVGIAAAGLSGQAKAQTVAIDGLGSSGLFLELGLGASSSTTGSIHATCVWSTKSDVAANTVQATDTKTGTALTDKGSAWVAWTPQSGSCTTINTSTQIYAYLQTDSVVGNRCLFNGSTCTISYPTGNPASEGLILGSSGEVALPAAIATKLNSAAVNVAGTDIRPEDAEFAVARALKPCGQPVATGSQYLGLGYADGGNIDSQFSSSLFHVISFGLPASYTVTPVGATPVVVVVNDTDTTNGLGQGTITNLSNSVLAKFLDGTNSFANQAKASPTNTGSAVFALIREPLSGTYNTMEYNIPNTTGNTAGITPASANKTSQDVGLNQLTAQRNCSSGGTGTVVGSNPMNIPTASGGARQRAIGTGQELSEVSLVTNALGYGFWSVANFASEPNTKYLTIDGVDPLLKSTVPYSTFNGAIPTTGSTELADVDLHTTAQGNYPIWSLLRLVNVGAAPAAVTNLATAAQSFVSFGTTTARPDFIVPSSLKVVRSHFIPPIGTGEPTTAANGHVGLTSSACTAAEIGGDVGGVVSLLTTDSAFCSANHVTTGNTGQRR